MTMGEPNNSYATIETVAIGRDQYLNMQRQVADVRTKNTDLEIKNRAIAEQRDRMHDKLNQIIEAIDWNNIAHTKTVDESDFTTKETLSKVAKERDEANERCRKLQDLNEEIKRITTQQLDRAKVLLGDAEMRHDVMLANFENERDACEELKQERERLRTLVRQYDDGHAALRKEIRELSAKFVEKSTTPQGGMWNMLKHAKVRITWRHLDGDRVCDFIPARIFWDDKSYVIVGTNEETGLETRFTEHEIVTWHVAFGPWAP